MTKTEAVRKHLENHGRINSLQAIKKYGATRLSAIIYNLRHRYGMTIINETKQCRDRFGNKVRYDDYVLIKKERDYE